MMRLPALCLLSLLAACQPSTPAADAAAQAGPAGSSAAAAAAPTADAAALAAVGGLRIGAAFDPLTDGQDFVAAGISEVIGEGCEYYDQGSLPRGISMMVIDDHIARFEAQLEDDHGAALDAPPAQAPPLPFGLWAGMGTDAAKQRLPAGVVVSPHAYVSPDGDYLTWTDTAANLAVRLETLNGVVTSIYWGRPAAVELIEGCV